MANMTTDPFPCPLCGKPRPWHVWFSKDGKGCRHDETPPVKVEADPEMMGNLIGREG